MKDAFLRLVADIPRIGRDWHAKAIVRHTEDNSAHIKREGTIREIPPMADADVLVVSAGPSLYRLRMLVRIASLPHPPVIVAVDGSYVQCLRAGIFPDYVLTLDPHPTRIVRWFGDPDFVAHSAGDDYFARQDLDEAFRADAGSVNAENIALVDKWRGFSSLVIASTAPENVVRRTQDFRRYWFAPLVDNPHRAESLTRRICKHTGLPALNTGGTVGTAAIMFTHCILRARRIAAVGMDLGYAADTPLERTQSWNMLKDRADVRDLYPRVQHPQWGECYTDPTYAWYAQNLKALLKSAGRTLYNCTGGGALYGPHIECCEVEEWARG